MAGEVKPWRRAFARFGRNSVARRAGWVLASLYAMALFADFLAPYGLHEARPEDRHHPPNASFVDARGVAHVRPFVQRLEPSFDEHRRRRWVGLDDERFAIGLFVEGQPYRLLGLIPARVRLFGLEGSGAETPRLYLLGATADGRDLFSCLIHGSRISLTIGLVGVAISFSIGLLVGGFSGYVGGRTDMITQRFLEGLMLLPGLYVILAVDYALGDRAITRAAGPPGSVEVFFTVVLVISAIQWAGLARVVRGQVLALREKEFVLAARALGFPTRRIVLRHVLPHTMSYALVAASLAVPGFILMESALSMLGLGIRSPQVSWGNLLAEAADIDALRIRPWTMAPGVLITVAVTAFHFVGDGLRDAIDPES